MAKLLFPDESYAMLEACFQVYKDKGCGFTEGMKLGILVNFGHYPKGRMTNCTFRYFLKTIENV